VLGTIVPRGRYCVLMESFSDLGTIFSRKGKRERNKILATAVSPSEK